MLENALNFWDSGVFMQNLFLRMFIQMFLKLKQNLLQNVLRSKFGIEENQKLIIIGNPPYNNKTLIIKNGVKSLFAIDKNLSHRDLGISFCVFCCFGPGICLCFSLAFDKARRFLRQILRRFFRLLSRFVRKYILNLKH